MLEATSNTQLLCPNCHALLPEERREFPWCECGWNLPPDPLDEMRGWPRFRGRLSRALGHWQNQQDARWIRSNPAGSIPWIALNGLMYSIGFASLLGAVLLYFFLVGMAIFGILAIPQNCLFALLPLGLSLPFLYYWRPYRTWLERRQGTTPEIQESVLETARGVADRLKISPPASVALSPWPVVHAGTLFRLIPLPHYERRVIIGLPVLSSLSVTDLKVLCGHAMLGAAGAQGVLFPAFGKVLDRVWKVFDYLSRHFFTVLVTLILMALAYGCMLFAPGFLSGRISTGQFAANLARDFTVSLLALLAGCTLLIWLAASWYRRKILLADQVVAKSFGRNALTQALSKARLVERTFARQWAGLSSDARWGKLPDSNLYAKFRDIWDKLPAAYKEKSLREVASDFPAFIYFEPTLTARSELLKDIPNQLTDNRPADCLLPSIRDVGKWLTDSILG